MKQKIILLNGPSSSGKSTLAAVLQRDIQTMTGDEYEIISIDHFLKMSVKDVIYEEDVYHISPLLCQKAKQALACKPGVIVDHVITSERLYQDFQEAMAGHQVCLIHVTCPLAILTKREQERGNRCAGSAAASYQFLYPTGGYDIVLDTSKLSFEDCSAQILQLLKF